MDTLFQKLIELKLVEKLEKTDWYKLRQENRNKKLKEKLYKFVVRPAALYGVETMPLTKVLEEKINTAEKRMLQFMKGVTRRDKIRNEEIRKSFGVE